MTVRKILEMVVSLFLASMCVQNAEAQTPPVACADGLARVYYHSANRIFVGKAREVTEKSVTFEIKKNLKPKNVEKSAGDTVTINLSNGDPLFKLNTQYLVYAIRGHSGSFSLDQCSGTRPWDYLAKEQVSMLEHMTTRYDIGSR